MRAASSKLLYVKSVYVVACFLLAHFFAFSYFLFVIYYGRLLHPYHTNTHQ
jgi:hypothetical protein